ncbi:hypothetical protein PILCRDRAFT_814058 [Piloderma croceum F 1598]|uniref:Uncharacterized protein n=1 Tax=Piloderma croceum (strain F 1598) TaxID=765440 RepID=A0A0C3GBX6_PILCF|nr:hypothetical protein PILCRDRAFT_814058 [Piloderma croceum F 1598]
MTEQSQQRLLNMELYGVNFLLRSSREYSSVSALEVENNGWCNQTLWGQWTMHSCRYSS